MISAISDVTERDGFEFADVISDEIYRRDISMNSHRVQLWCKHNRGAAKGRLPCLFAPPVLGVPVHGTAFP